MHFSAHRITALTLAALLAAVACFEHALHDVSHGHPANSCCQHGKLDAAPAGHCCSHRHAACETSPAPDESNPTPHDPDNCAVCRYLALPQLFEAPPDLLLAESVVCGAIAWEQPSSPSRIVTLVPIRGPPMTDRELSV
jgi:hypothetical protein